MLLRKYNIRGCFAFHLTYLGCSIPLRKRKPRRQRSDALCMQHSPTAAALSTSFILNHAPNSPELNALITWFNASFSSVSMSCESKKIEEFKQQLVECWQCTTAFEWEMQFSCLNVLPGSGEAQVTYCIWGGIVKRLMISYFITNVSAKKYQNPFTYVKFIASQMWDIFETRCT